VHALAGLPLVVPPVLGLRRDLVTELATLREQHLSMLGEICARWRPFGDQQAEARSPDSPAEVVRDCVGQSLHALAAGLLTDDSSVLAGTRAWVTAVLAARGDRQAEAHAAELGELLGTLFREYPLTEALLTANW